jgi:TRAP-type C4-dicarboxylate transport system substrate-binding protein
MPIGADNGMKHMNKLNRTLLTLALGLVAAGANAATIKIATIAPDGTAWMREMRAAGDAIKTKTDGRVEMKFYPGGVMGDDATVLRKMKIGQLQGGAFTGGEASILTGDSQIYSLPFTFRSEDEIAKARAKLDPMLKESFAKAGYELLGVSGGGFAYLMSTRTIHSRDDLKAAKVWGRSATRSPRWRSRPPASRRSRCRCRTSTRACRPGSSTPLRARCRARSRSSGTPRSSTSSTCR